MATPKRLEEQTIKDMQWLRRIGLSKARIARYYNVSIPTVTYHTKNIKHQLSPGQVVNTWRSAA